MPAELAVRRFHLMAVGLPRTGTASLAAIFARHRAEHEHDAEGTVRALLRGDFDYLRERDRLSQLEMDSASFLHLAAPQLPELFPEARFVLTVRDSLSWVDSFLDLLQRLRPFPSWVRAFVERTGDTAPQLLDYWEAAHRQILASIPAERLLILPTQQLSPSLLAAFAGVEESSLRFEHRNRGGRRECLLPPGLGPRRVEGLPFREEADYRAEWRFPPGPEADLDFFEPALARLRRDPIDFFRRMAGHGDFTFARVAGRRVYLVSRPDLVRTALLESPELSKGFGVGSRAAPSLEEHRAGLRGVRVDRLRRSRLLEDLPWMEALAREQIASWPEEGDLRGLLRGVTREIMGRLLFGDDYPQVREAAENHSERFVECAGAQLGGLEPQGPPRDDYAYWERAFGDGAARLLPGTDPDVVNLLYMAGEETTATVLTWLLWLLARHPGEWPFEHVLQETLRLYPPAWVLSRGVTEAVEIEGFRVPAGSLVVACPHTMHRDPRFFQDPTAFRPERWAGPPPPPCAFFPFGLGARRCLGEQLAWLLVELLLRLVREQWRVEPLADPEPEPMLSLHPRGGLPVRLQRL